MNAQDRGAVGAIIYSDPQEDGSGRGPTYPAGGWRPSSSVQRGSVQFASRCAGDPTRAANPRTVEDICGFSKEELIPAIPVMPISVRKQEEQEEGRGGYAEGLGEGATRRGKWSGRVRGGGMRGGGANFFFLLRGGSSRDYLGGRSD